MTCACSTTRASDEPAPPATHRHDDDSNHHHVCRRARVARVARVAPPFPAHPIHFCVSDSSSGSPPHPLGVGQSTCSRTAAAAPHLRADAPAHIQSTVALSFVAAAKHHPSRIMSIIVFCVHSHSSHPRKPHTATAAACRAATRQMLVSGLCRRRRKTKKNPPLFETDPRLIYCTNSLPPRKSNDACQQQHEGSAPALSPPFTYSSPPIPSVM